MGSIQGMVGPDYTLYEGLNWGSPPDYFFHKGGLLQLTRYAASRLGPRGAGECDQPGWIFCRAGSAVRGAVQCPDVSGADGQRDGFGGSDRVSGVGRFRLHYRGEHPRGCGVYGQVK